MLTRIRKALIAATLMTAAYAGEAAAAPDSCRDYDPNGTWWYIDGATVDWVLVPQTSFARILVAAHKGGCSGIFYFNRTDKEMLATLLTAKASGQTVRMNFYADNGSADDVNYNGTIATNELGAVTF